MAATLIVHPQIPRAGARLLVRPAPVAVPTYRVTVGLDGAGTLDQSPPGASQPLGTVVVFYPTPDAGQRFVGWAIDGADAGAAVPLILTLAADVALVARFAALPPAPAAAVGLFVRQGGGTTRVIYPGGG